MTSELTRDPTVRPASFRPAHAGDAGGHPLSIDDIDYELPEQRIAQQPAEPRDSARLLVCARASARHEAQDPAGRSLDPRLRVSGLAGCLAAGDLLVVNETRVLRARVIARRRTTGGRAEVLFLRPATAAGAGGASVGNLGGSSDPREATGWWEALVRPSRRLHAGEIVDPSAAGGERWASEARVGGREQFGIEIGPVIEGGRRLVRALGGSVDGLLESFGEVPLPPYFRGSLGDDERYQTVFARSPGSAAAPTAGLHFTRDLLESLDARGIRVAAVDLAIGPETFRPITSSDPRSHAMGEEAFRVPPETARAWEQTRGAGGAVVAVGTTALRTLEASVVDGQFKAGAGATGLMISPGYHFRAVDGLLTNFHAPRTSMLMLLAALYPGWRAAYDVALGSGFRFLSFGDAMLVLPAGRHLPG